MALTGPVANASWTSGMSAAGKVKITLIGCTWVPTTRPVVLVGSLAGAMA